MGFRKELIREMTVKKGPLSRQSLNPTHTSISRLTLDSDSPSKLISYKHLHLSPTLPSLPLSLPLEPLCKEVTSLTSYSYQLRKSRRRKRACICHLQRAVAEEVGGPVVAAGSERRPAGLSGCESSAFSSILYTDVLGFRYGVPFRKGRRNREASKE